ncbi:MAG: helix-turn-helix transcriptional regulator [Clostridiales bacterium]
MENRIQELRRLNKMKLDELAKKLNVNIRTIQRYETGERIPSPEKLILLSEIFNCSIDYIYKRTDFLGDFQKNSSINVDSTTKTIFLDRVRLLMIQKEITKEYLSKKTNIDNNDISKYITGDEFPSIENLKKIVMELGTSIDYLVGINDDYIINEIQDKWIEIKIGNKVQKIPIQKIKDFLN